MHEALSRSVNEYDPQTTLLKNYLELIEESINKVTRTVIKITIKSPKEDRDGKDMDLEIFGNNTFLCPNRAMSKYLKERQKLKGSLEEAPLFIKKDLKCLTGTEFNSMLTHLTSEVTQNTNGIVRSHSLRAGVPSELAKLGADPQQIQGVGRWSSEAWKDYCKLGRRKRMVITDNLCSAIV